jgi:aerobic carbon-monoxide dehydrogenase medium subunit
MKASAFAYARATSVDEALKLLAAHGEKAKLLSGGQSLMPAMNLRLISPELLVDIGGLDELRGIAVTNDVVRIGALTRHVDLLKCPEIAVHAPLLAEAVAHVAIPRSATGERSAAALLMPIRLPSSRPACSRLTRPLSCVADRASGG